MSRRTPLLPTAAGLLAAGCTGFDRQSALHPAGTQADRIHGLWDLYLGVCVVVYVLVVAFVVAAVVRRNRAGSDAPVSVPPAVRELRKGLVVAGLVGLTVLILFVFLVADFLTGRHIDSLADSDALTVQVTGHQWWWEVRYDTPTPSSILTTANEIHVPAGRTVRFELASSDVIHSFWVPNLHGKTDMIPGHPTRTFIRVDHPGEFWGQCAEFCGHQHANMRFQVIAEPEEKFREWYAAQLRPAPEPSTESQKRGRQVFLTKQCVLCHTINGTRAQARVGPALTHVASRLRIAAGTLPNTRGNLAGWVSDAQSIKPGVLMPPSPLAPDELQALLDYLETLK
jgi:cytochrome c oxidase subunit 2